jgi:cytochrome P450
MVTRVVVRGPRGVPLFGNLFQLAEGPLEFFTHIARSYGDVGTWRVGRRLVHGISDPILIEKILVQHSGSFVKDPITRRLSDVLGNGLVTAEGEVWKTGRRRVGPAFQRDQLSHYGDLMVESTRRWTDAVRHGERKVFHPEMGRLTLEIVVRTLFGAEPNPKLADVGATVGVLMHGFERYLRSWQRLLPDALLGPARRRIQKQADQLNAVLLEIVQERRASPERGNDVLSRLLDAQDEAGAMSDAQLRDEAITIFVAGHETTALALTFALYLLGWHASERNAIAREAHEVLGDRPATYADLPRLVRTKAVVQEAMRLYPPAYAIGREAIEEVDLGDVVLPKGAIVVMAQWVVHRDPRWYRDPEVFRPERWLDGSLDGNPKFAYFPFGGGPRTCVGNHFAMMEAVLVLATIVQQLDWSNEEVPDLPLATAVTLRPTYPLSARFERRSP